MDTSYMESIQEAGEIAGETLELADAITDTIRIIADKLGIVGAILFFLFIPIGIRLLLKFIQWIIMKIQK